MSHIYRGVRVKGNLTPAQKRHITLAINRLAEAGIPVLKVSEGLVAYAIKPARGAVTRRAALAGAARVQKLLVMPEAPAEVKPKRRLPCAYGSKECKGRTFLAKGTGPTEHTTCEKGKEAMKKAVANAAR